MPERLIDEMVRRGTLRAADRAAILSHHHTHGGAIDTAIFELGLAREAEVSDAMPRAYGVPAARALDVQRPFDQAAQHFPEPWAMQFGLAPLMIERGRRELLVLASLPPDFRKLKELGDSLQLRLRALLAPEARVQQRLALLYNTRIPERLARVLMLQSEAPARRSSVPPPVSAIEDRVPRLRDAATEDEIADLVVAHAGRQLAFAALLSVRADGIRGQSAAGPGAERITHLSIPAGVPSRFWTVATSGTPFFGPILDADREALAALGRATSSACLIVPLRSGDDALALLYADNAAGPITPTVAADLLICAAHAQLVGSDLRASRANVSAIRESAPVASRSDAEDEPALELPWSLSQLAKAAPTADVEEPRVSVSPQRDTSSAPLDTLVARLVSGNAADRRSARPLLERAGSEVLPRLATHFPGPVSCTSFAAHDLPPLGDCGDLLAVLLAHGERAHPFVVEHLDAQSTATRLFATYFYAEVPVPAVIPRLLRRLHDEDSTISMLAVRALARFRARPEFEQVQEHLRARINSPSASARARAAELFGRLFDESAVGILIDALERKDKRLSEAAEAALVEITKQSLGDQSRKWRAWHEAHKHEPRILWLIRGLWAKERRVRDGALGELKNLAGTTHGYDVDAPVRERDEAGRRWVAWWQGQKSAG